MLGLNGISMRFASFTGMGFEIVGEGMPAYLVNLMVQSELLARIKTT
jgi:hypothetical protein